MVPRRMRSLPRRMRSLPRKMRGLIDCFFVRLNATHKKFTLVAGIFVPVPFDETMTNLVVIEHARYRLVTLRTASFIERVI